MDLKRFFATCTLALLGFGWSAPSQAATCNIVAEKVSQSSAYSGFSESRMCDAGLKPLWNGLPEGVASTIRFTFTSGHSMFFRTVTITEFADGSGRLEVVGGGHVKRDVRTRWRDIRPVRRKLSADDLVSLRKLIEQTDTFGHEIGSWDKSGEEMPIYMHCQLLEMEQMDVQGYRFSSVNIGCNRPNKLMPLVDDIIARAKIGMVRSNWAGYRKGD